MSSSSGIGCSAGGGRIARSRRARARVGGTWRAGCGEGGYGEKGWRGSRWGKAEEHVRALKIDAAAGESG